MVNFELMKKLAILPEIPSCILFYLFGRDPLKRSGRAIRYNLILVLDTSAKKRKLELTNKDFHFYPSRVNYQ